MLMFDFEKLDVYTQIRGLNEKVLSFLYNQANIDPFIRDQFQRASVNIALNLAEGTGRMAVDEKRSFYTKARSSTFECVAILHIIYDQKIIDEYQYTEFYLDFEKTSKMLLGMIRSLEQQQQS